MEEHPGETEEAGNGFSLWKNACVPGVFPCYDVVYHYRTNICIGNAEAVGVMPCARPRSLIDGPLWASTRQRPYGFSLTCFQMFTV